MQGYGVLHVGSNMSAKLHSRQLGRRLSEPSTASVFLFFDDGCFVCRFLVGVVFSVLCFVLFVVCLFSFGVFFCCSCLILFCFYDAPLKNTLMPPHETGICT